MRAPDCFRTARLSAERLAPHHLAELIRFHRDGRVMAELGGVRDEEQTAQYLTRNVAHWAHHGFGVWMLRDTERPELIGRALLRYLPLDGADEVEVGFALYPEFWGRGLATEVAQRCVDIARSALRLESLVGVTTPSNHRSQHVLRTLGFSYEREVVIAETSCRLYRLSLTPGPAPAGSRAPA